MTTTERIFWERKLSTLLTIRQMKVYYIFFVLCVKSPSNGYVSECLNASYCLTNLDYTQSWRLTLEFGVQNLRWSSIIPTSPLDYFDFKYIFKICLSNIYLNHLSLWSVAYRGGVGGWGVQPPPPEIPKFWQSCIWLQIERKIFSVPTPTSWLV